jgi:hypothetical protein
MVDRERWDPLIIPECCRGFPYPGGWFPLSFAERPYFHDPMKRIAAAIAVFAVLLSRLPAAPVGVPNFSFELPNNPTTGTTWSYNLTSWIGSGGNNNTNGFVEYIAGFRADAGQNIGGGVIQNDQHLGMELGYDIFQSVAGVTFQANTLYTLTVAVGNRSGVTAAGNQSVYGLADASGLLAVSGVRDASGVPVGTFADAPVVAVDTFADPCIVGKGLQILLQARGAGRSHFDNVRLDASPSVANGRPVAVLNAATGVTATGATLNGTVTDPGASAPAVVFYWATSDRGGDPAAWPASQVVAGTQTGAFGADVTGLQPATTYFFRARATNASGGVWASPCLSFTTVASAPVVENGGVSEITATSAKLAATVTSTGGVDPAVTIFYGLADGGTDAAAWASSVVIPGLNGTGQRTVTGLQSGKAYFFRAYGENVGGGDWADSSGTFGTLTVTSPAVTVAAADNITGSSAVLRGRVTSTGNEPPVVTLYWGLADGGTNPAAWANSRVLGPDSGDFSSLVQGLAPQTTYFFTARAVNGAGSAWAAASRTFGTVTLVPTSVIINEINYDTVDATKALEFIEFHNPTNAAIDMSGWELDSGVDFVFPGGTVIPAGGFLVVAEDPLAFAFAYPLAGLPLGPWTGSLSNGGELIRLRDAAGAMVDEVDYGAGFPWPTGAAGTGASMELLHPNLNNDLGGNWRTGVSAGTQTTYVATSTSGWRYLPGAAEASNPVEAWRSEAFTETTWFGATLPLGYGDIDGNAVGNDVTTTIAANQKTVFLRRQFFVSGVLPSKLVLNLRCDDGCIAFINGVEVGRIRVEAGAVPPFDAPDGTAANVTEPPLLWEAPVVIENAAAVLKAGTNVLAIQLINTTTASSDLFIDADLKTPPPAAATPGAVNRALLTTPAGAPPAIRNVDHAPKQPVAGEPVVVTATVTDPEGVASVTLSYQVVNPGTYIRRTDAAYNLAANWTTVTMTDDGSGGDAVAGDAVYSATLPAGVQVHRRLVRYRIAATDGGAAAVTVPYPDDEQPNFAYFCYNGIPAWTGAMRPAAFSGYGATPRVTFPASLISSIEPYHLIALDADVALCLYTGPTDSTPYRGTFVYEGKVYDHITFNVRGIGSTRVSGKNKLAFKFNRARDFAARDNWGRKYSETWNSFGLDANASPWAAVHRGSAGVEEATSYRIFELAGMNSLRTHYAHLRIIRKAAETPPAGTNVSDATAGGTVDGQYSSDLWGLYMVLEPTEGNFIGERDLPPGNIYAIEGNNGDKKYQAPGQPLDGSDWNNFRTALVQTGQTEAWYRGNLDLDDLYTYLGLNRLIGNVDVRPGDNYRFYHSPEVLNPVYPGGHWKIMGYDHDMQFIAGHHWGGTINSLVVAGAPNAIIAIMRHPVLALEYRNRCRELLGLMGSDAGASGGQIAQIIDEYAQMINPVGQALTWADLDAHMWNLHPRSAGSGANTGQSSHRGNFFRALYLDGTRGGLGGTVQTGSWVRNLPDPDGNGFSDHEGIVGWMRDYATNTYPAATAWTRRATSAGTGAGGGGTDNNVNRQRGYGYKYLEWETLYGGYANGTTNPNAGTAIGDLTAAGTTRYAVNGDSLQQLSAANNVLYPDKPQIAYTGAPGFPVNAVIVRSSDYRDPQGDAIAAVQWRVGEISAPGIPLYDPTRPRVYEIEDVWRSGELPAAGPTNLAEMRIPASVLRVGRTYRARVRHKDGTGRWSYWSEPVQFVAATADVTPFAAVLRISEINYNPGALTAAEVTNPGWNAAWTEQDFEFIELTNIASTAIELTDVRFTKGIDFDFPVGYSLAAGGTAVVVRNAAAFAIRYPGVVVAGTYGPDNLANAGEGIKLSYGTGIPIIEFAYGDREPWPQSPDGSGPTLELIAPAKVGLDHGNPLEWRASGAVNGSPGQQVAPAFASFAWQYGLTGGPLGDDDGDGVANQLEYAFGMNPLVSSQAGLPVGGTDGRHAVISFTRPALRPDLEYRAQFGFDLQTWRNPPVFVGSVTNADGSVTETWRSKAALSAGNLYARVRVVLR